ncbi:MAG: hypothetical protein L6Q34_01670 [Nitrospira sp.]|nr:hypothetical protein [Nitrospira sp.]MCK6498267.1 hypothetical protein [Nitrospira sp.]
MSAYQDGVPSDYPRSLERDLATLLFRLAVQGEQAEALRRAAEIYVDLADDLFEGETKKRLAYEAVLHVEQPHYSYAWKRIFLPEAGRLLKTLCPS